MKKLEIGNWKLVGFVLLFLFSASVGQSVFALGETLGRTYENDIPITITCGENKPDTKYAVFGVTGLYNYPEFRGPQACIEVRNNEDRITYEKLQGKGLFPDDRLFESYQGDSQRLCFSPLSLGEAFTDDNLVLNSGVREMNFFLNQRVGTPCDDGVTSGDDEPRVRYRIETQEGDRFIYFLGFKEGGEVGAVGADCSSHTAEGEQACAVYSGCFWLNNQCTQKFSRINCALVPKNLCGTPSGSLTCAWNNTIGRCISALEQNLANDHKSPGEYAWALPPCAFEGTCRNVNDVLQVAVTYAKGLFGIIGTAGLLFFIYGGFTIVMSGGSSDKVGKGKEIIVSAIIGIIICFSAYIAVDFLLDALQVGSEFREIGTSETQQ